MKKFNAILIVIPFISSRMRMRNKNSSRIGVWVTHWLRLFVQVIIKAIHLNNHQGHALDRNITPSFPVTSLIKIIKLHSSGLNLAQRTVRYVTVEKRPHCWSKFNDLSVLNECFFIKTECWILGRVNIQPWKMQSFTYKQN